MTVLRCLLFDFHSIATGLCVPGYAAIRAKTGFCFTTISGALDRLAGAGIITVIKRLGWADLDRKIVKQMTNAYIFRKPPTEKVAIIPNRSQPRSLRFNLESKAVRAVQAVANPVVKTLQGGLDAALASLGAAIHAKSG